MRVSEVRHQLIKGITAKILATDLDLIELPEMDVYDYPIVVNDRKDDENIFTLDRIVVGETEKGKPIIYLECSSNWDNDTLILNQVSTDELEGILDWLINNEEALNEYKETIQEHENQL